MTVSRANGARLAALALTAVALASCGSTTATTGPSGSSTPSSERVAPDTGADAIVKKVFKEDDTDIKVTVGEKFGIRLKENPSIGDKWIVISQPDPSYLKDDGDTFKSDQPDPQPGTGGQREFKYKARAPGTTTITFLDCYRCGPGTSVTPDNAAQARRVTFTVTVS